MQNKKNSKPKRGTKGQKQTSMELDLNSPMRLLKSNGVYMIKSIPKTISLNQYRNTHHYKLNSLKVDYHKLTQALTRGVQRLSSPISLKFHFNAKGIPRDLDGEIINAKWFIDSLVLSGKIEDDSPKYIKSIELLSKENPLKERTYDVEIYENN